MQKGFNTDLIVRGINYHVQTEDWGQANPFLVSRIFQNGAVIKTIKVSHQEALALGPISQANALQLALKRQHHHILDQVFEGKI